MPRDLKKYNAGLKQVQRRSCFSVFIVPRGRLNTTKRYLRTRKVRVFDFRPFLLLYYYFNSEQ